MDSNLLLGVLRSARPDVTVQAALDAEDKALIGLGLGIGKIQEVPKGLSDVVKSVPAGAGFEPPHVDGHKWEGDGDRGESGDVVGRPSVPAGW